MAGQDKKGSSKAPVEKEDKLDSNLLSDYKSRLVMVE